MTNALRIHVVLFETQRTADTLDFDFDFDDVGL